ncbi:glycosyltransferase family 4 protein [Haloferula rosea]|uniref:Glycosyltransferase n=1 Tax=Haloferula rosea TaxID=490093 RepID=A0A934VGA4_9BACT|nr:glycosyltransferase [Haloferula rosea]MBK1827822.1 glycosyltransferase [Haloferula rosea]
MRDAGKDEDGRPAMLIVGQLPPPWHGQAIATRMLFKHHWQGFRVCTLRMAYSGSMEVIGHFRLGKVMHLLHLIRRTRGWLRANPGSVLFYPPASPQWVPFIRDFIYLSLTRRHAGSTVFIYHAGGLADWVSTSALRRWMASRVYHRADLSLEVADETPSPRVLFEARRGLWCPYGVDVPNPPEARQCVSDRFEVLFVGSLQEGKGVLEVIRTAAHLAERGARERYRFRLVGAWFSPEFEAEAEALIEECEVSDMVEVVGQLTGDEKWAAYHRADLFFFPTHYASEAFPLVLIEALGSGLPVVTTQWRGIPSLLKGCDQSTLCPVRDIAGFSRAIETWEQRRDDRRDTAKCSQSFYQQRYLPSRFLERVASEIRRVVGNGASQVAAPSEATQRKAKWRIIQVFNQYLDRGGEEVWVNEMVRLCSERFEIHDLRFHSRAWVGRGKPNRLVQATRMWDNPHTRRILREAVIEHRPDVLVFHNVIPVASLGLYFEAQSLGVPVIQFAHNFRPFSISGTLWFQGAVRDDALRGNTWPEILHGAWEGSIIKTALLGWHFRRLRRKGGLEAIRRWVTVSDFMARKFVEAGVPPDRVTGLRHCWHSRGIEPSDSEGDYYLYIGRLVPEKGIAVLLEAWRLLADRLGTSCPPLLIAGSGPEEAKLHKLTLNNRTIHCIGFVDGEAKDRLIAGARALIAPSIWWEPLGLIVYEAYEQGRPVLAARSGGLEETVVPEVTGFLHDPGDHRKLAEDVILLENMGREGRKLMGRQGHEWLVRNACPESWKDAFEKIVADVAMKD